MRSRMTFAQIMGLLMMLLSLIGFTALGITANPASVSALAGLDIADIDCADLITADTIGHEEFERYGIAEKLQNGAFAAHEYLGYIVCGTGQPRSDGDVLGLFRGMYYMFDAKSGELAVTRVERAGQPPEAAPTPEPVLEPVKADLDDPDTTTVCIDATTPILEVGGENPEQLDFWGILANAPCGLEISSSICLDCGEDVIWRWLVPTPTVQGAEASTGENGGGGMACFTAQMAVEITGQELDEDYTGRLVGGLCGMQFGPGDQVCWQCMEEAAAPTPAPSPTERPRKDPVCSDYLTPEVVGLEEWEKYGIAEKLRTNEIQRHLSEVSDRIVCYGHRTIDGVVVGGDELYYMFDIESGGLLKERIHWREDLPEQLPALRISQEEAESMVEGKVNYSSLVILSPDHMLFQTTKPSFQDPCWAVSSREGGDLDTPWVTVINAMTGEVLGRYCPC